MPGKAEVYRRSVRTVMFFIALVFARGASAQETAITRLDLPLGRAYPFRAAEVITRVTVANPLDTDRPLMATTLLPGLLSTALRNIARGTKDLALYEIGQSVPAMTPMRVLLPMPLGPMSAMTWPRSTVRFTRRRTGLTP